MKRVFKFVTLKFMAVALYFGGGAVWASGQRAADPNDGTKANQQVNFSHVKINDSFWSPRLQKLATATLPVCINQIEVVTGRMQNFKNAATHSGKHSGVFFDDSDVYKAMEGMAYSLINNPNAEIEAKLDEWVDNVAAAQESDGYINTYFSLTGLDGRWIDMNMHEMYCAGHLLEAGIAYYQATGKTKLLDVGKRMVEHMMTVFGEGKRHWVAGHEEIELALVKLYDVTKEKKYLDFAYWLLEERGHGYGTNGKNDDWNKTYFQDEVPVKDLRSIGGHAVRAMYLFCGMADVAAHKSGTGYLPALNELWTDVTERNMYITGGIGSSSTNEGFTQDYDLPNATAYCETCASVGMVLWNHRMNEFYGDSKYVDVMERSLYNGLLAGINLAGDRFFYVNPLASDGGHHRQAWYGTACCPSNLSRFLPSLGSYIYGTSDDALWVNLFIGNEATVNIGGRDVKLSMETGYPWNGSVKLTLENDMDKDVRIRIPGWCKSFALKVNGADANYKIDRGYAVVSKDWKASDCIELSLGMDVEVVEADHRVAANVGLRAVQRGPLVYCAEAVDNVDNYDNIQVSDKTKFQPLFDASLLGGVEKIVGEEAGASFTLIPYYAWDNRQAGKMKVWLDFSNFKLLPQYSFRKWGFQYGNITPVDLMNNGQKQLLIGAWFKNGTEEPRHGTLLATDGLGNWNELANPLSACDRPSFSPCDINADGMMDIVVFEQTGNFTEGVYLGNGDGTFVAMDVELVDANKELPSNFDGPFSNLFDIVTADVADFNNDGRWDIVGIGTGAANVVLLNQGIKGNKISFSPVYFDNGITDSKQDVVDGKPYNGRNFVTAMVYAQDFNNDGFADILISADNRARQNYDADWERFTEVYLNKGDGTKFERTYFAAPKTPDTNQNPSASDGGVAIADFNNDGYLDFFIQGAGGYFWYYWDHSFVCVNDGTGHFHPLPLDDFDRMDIRNGNSVGGGANAYDWDGDGFIDIIYQGECPSLSTQTGFIWANNANGNAGSFERRHRWAGGVNGASCLVDWNGDGIKDLVNTGSCMDASFLNDDNNGRTMTVTLATAGSDLPAAPASVDAKVNGNKVTLSWTPAADAPRSTTYELYLQNEKGLSLTGARAYTSGVNEGLRKCEEFGKLGCVTSITYNLPEGDYTWGVQAVNGRRVGSKFAKGSFKIGSSSFVEEIEDKAIPTVVAVYNVAGVELDKEASRGVVLERMSDGSVRKVMKK